MPTTNNFQDIYLDVFVFPFLFKSFYQPFKFNEMGLMSTITKHNPLHLT